MLRSPPAAPGVRRLGAGAVEVQPVVAPPAVVTANVAAGQDKEQWATLTLGDSAGTVTVITLHYGADANPGTGGCFMSGWEM